MVERKIPRLRRGLRRRTASAASALPAASGPGLIVATYNVHTCVGIDLRYDPVRIAAVLRELDADIIGLQEVDARDEGIAALDQARFFAGATGLRVVTGADSAKYRGRFGNAILTRLPVRAVRHIDLGIAGCEPRGAIDVDLDFAGRTLRVVATHFGLRSTERRQQTRRLLAALAGTLHDHTEPAADGDPLLIMGDLNEWRGRRGGIPSLERALGRAPAPRTFPSWCPILPLDRIYAGPAAILRNVRVHRSALARIASDHLPLRAEFALAQRHAASIVEHGSVLVREAVRIRSSG